MRSIIIITLLLGLYGLVLTPARFHFEQKKNKTFQIGALGNYSSLNLVSCSNGVCIEVISNDAVHGLLGNVSIKKASVLIQDQNTKNSIAKFHSSAFYDARFGRIYFTEVKNSKFKEAYFDQQNGKFITM